MGAFVRTHRWGLVGVIAIVFAVALALPVTAAKRSGAAQRLPDTGRYVVQLKSPPLASYRGGTRGIPATSPKGTRRKLDSRSTAARAYRTYLDGRQRAALARLGGVKPRVIYSYRTAFAGFAARLTGAQVAALRKAPEVARVTKTELRRLDSVATDNAALDNGTNPDSAAYLDLPEGLWNRLGGSEGAGEGVIVGVIDTGIQPGHPSFADDPADGYTGPAYSAVPDTWNGTCQTGPGFAATDCNNKLIGARFFVDGFGPLDIAPGAKLSPRDDDGHGSHTASTAAGNFGVDPVIDGNALGVNRISGIAPRARVAAYKACWTGGVVADGCSSDDTTAAIDAAVADGVDVINYSVGSDTSTVIGPDEVAFLGASDAGVFVANSAGNAGPGAETVGSPASVPWLTTVAAATTARTFTATATITDAPGALALAGGSATTALPAATTLVDSADAALAPATTEDAELCKPDSLDPAKVAGTVVLCLRGDNGRIEKSKVVDEAGGVGMILYNAVDPQDLSAYPYWIPTVALTHADGLLVKAAIADAGSVAKASISAGTVSPTTPAVLAAFSSRGPQTAVPDLAKPDVTAMGVDILAAAADQVPPTGEIKAGRLFQVISGTSMSSPHVAGAGALLTQLHPTFSSAALKSSLMTSADAAVVKREDETTPADPFDAGSGQIDPNAAADPGLVLDASTDDYFEYLEAVGVVESDGQVIQPADLNLASISNSAVAASASTSRRFTSVDSAATHWTVEVQGVDGFTATPSVAEFTIKPGQSREIGLDFLVTDAPLEEYAFGALVLTDGERTVRLPISLRPTALAAPDAVAIETAAESGSQTVSVRSGFTGQLSAAGLGLAAPDVKAGETVGLSPSGGPDPAGEEPGTRMYTFDVADPSQLFDTRLANVDAGETSTDLDMYVYRDANGDEAFDLTERVDYSASGTSDEEVQLPDPEPGRYGVEIVGFATQTPASTFDLNTWIVSDTSPDDPGDGPGLKVSGDPATVATGDNVDLDVDWSNVKAKGTYMGVVTYHNGATPAGERLGSSIVELVKTADSPTPGQPGGPGGGTTPPPTIPPVVQPNPAKLKLTLSSARLKGRTLTLRLRSNRRVKVRTTVKRGKRKVASAKARVVTTKTRVLRVHLNRKLRRGRTYTVRIAAYSGKRLADADSVRMRLRR